MEGVRERRVCGEFGCFVTAMITRRTAFIWVFVSISIGGDGNRVGIDIMSCGDAVIITDTWHSTVILTDETTDVASTIWYFDFGTGAA